jgi:hypothetical protein
MNDRTNFSAKSTLLSCQEPAAVAEASCQNGQGNAIPPQKAEKSPPSALAQLLTIEITRRWYYAIAACIILFVFQALWTVGSNLLSALPKPPADETTIMARIITKAPPTEQGSSDYSLWLNRRQNAVEALTPWVKLTKFLDFDDWKWLRSAHSKPKKVDDIILQQILQQDTEITEAKNRMDLLQQFILPLLYGWIGALAYILRSLSEQIRLWTYRKENSVLCDLRMLLGMVAGLAIGWFFKPSGTEVNGVGLVSPFALAFLAGYSVDLLFTVMDRVVATFSKAVPMEPPGRTPPVTRAIADSSLSDTGSAKAASSDSAKSAKGPDTVSTVMRKRRQKASPKPSSAAALAHNPDRLCAAP